jgi:hypothetical protein
MKRILLTILVASAPAFALAQDLSVTIQQEAKKCAKALLRADFDGVALYTHKRVIDGMGGKEAMVAAMKRGTEDMRTRGISFEDATIGEPEKPQKIDGWLVALIPQRILMKVPDGWFEQESHLLGISEDEGKKWVFIDVGPLTKAQFTEIFPELVGKIDLPTQKRPVFKVFKENEAEQNAADQPATRPESK